MGAEGPPKQYLRIAEKTVLEWSVGALLSRQDCAGVVVALAEGDEHWRQLSLRDEHRVITVTGGGQRTDSVAAGLEALASQCGEKDWVLVHDAARPCLSPHDLQQLIDALRDDEVGGLLAAPVVDTLKRSDGNRVAQTVSREGLWRALTPQMFRYGLLRRALSEAKKKGMTVTDEAQAIEFLGLKPRLVPGNADNIKVTLVEDLKRAERILLNTGTQAR
jgi:2-C-methyl-D-erythritol 4-phosphate cytidylyltransferase